MGRTLDPRPYHEQTVECRSGNYFGSTFPLAVGMSSRCSFCEPKDYPRSRTGLYELKFHGYRALAIKSGGRVQLRSPTDNDFTARYPRVAEALSGMADDTVIEAKLWHSMLMASLPSICCRIMVQREARLSRPGAPLRFFVFDLLLGGACEFKRDTRDFPGCPTLPRESGACSPLSRVIGINFPSRGGH